MPEFQSSFVTGSSTEHEGPSNHSNQPTERQHGRAHQCADRDAIQQTDESGDANASVIHSD